MRRMMFVIWLIFITSFTFSLPPSDLLEARNTYCKIPPFLQESTFANLLMVIDISGSMKSYAYGDDTYDPEKRYGGIFDPDAYYACYKTWNGRYYYDAESCNSNYGKRYWVKIDDDICEANSSSPCEHKRYYSDINVYARSGNYLNWKYLRRIDVIRWVLTGGRVVNIAGTEAVKFYYGQAVKAEDTTSYNPETGQVEGILHKIQRLKKRPRIGAYFFHNYHIHEKVALDYDYSSLIQKINTISVSGSTPTKYALTDAKRYFSRKDGIYGGFVINDSTDPYKFTINNRKITIRCAKNYIMLLTDGEWNTGGDPLQVAYDTWKGGHADLVSDLNGNQNAKIYTVALFMTDGAGKNAVQHIAIFGGFTDIDNDQMPCGYSDFPDSSKDPIIDITDPTYSSCRNEWDAQPQDGLPDTFGSGSDPEGVRKTLNEIFEAILVEISSGTSISVLSEERAKSAVLVQAIFSPQKYINGYKVKWIGQLFSYWFYNSRTAQNIREDTDQNKKLNILDDNILKFRIDTNGNLAIDVFESDSYGRPRTKIDTYFSLESIKYLWEAGEKLKNTDAKNRTIYAVDDTGNMREFTITNSTYFENKLGTDPAHFPDCLKNDTGIDYEKLIKYIRGEEIPGCRSRKVDNTGYNAGDVWKLGDIIYSTPRIVEYDNYSVVYTSSNDGILHAFKLGKIVLGSGTDLARLEGTDLGEELWGFIPSTSLAFLRYLADPDYCHMYIHDLSPFIFRADYDNDGNDEVVLIGGLRLGGGCKCSGKYCVEPPSDRDDAYSQYYALDITDPKTPQLLWEFKDTELGFSYSGPGVIKAKDDRYYVVFASGPTSYSAQFENATSRTLKIFLLDLKTGTLLRTIDTGINKAFAGRIFSEGYDLNENGYTDFIVFGYTRQDGSETNYKGGLIFLAADVQGNKLYPLDSESDYTRWTFANITSLGTDIPPVTAKVELEKCFDKWYMFLGTGRWFEKDDDWEVQPSNILFGIPIKPNTGSGVVWNYSSYNYVEVSTNTQDVTDIRHVKNICTDANNGVIRGWYLRLDRASGNYLKEKAISKPSTTDKNVVFFPTIFPSSDYCDYGGNSRVWVLNCATGDAIFSNSCPLYEVNINQFDFLLQLSGGDIQEIQASSLNMEGGRATDKMAGIASEEGGVPIIPSISLKGRILLWIEK